MNPVWVEKAALLLLHGESLAEHGGSSGIRDEGLLDSAVGRPRHRFEYELPHLHELAAAYGFAIAKNHPFIDGNKRAAILVTGLFLLLNRSRLDATQADTTNAILSLADGSLGEAAFAQWLRAHAKSTAKRPRTDPSKKTVSPSRNKKR